VVRDVS